jgi:hypothetical protein
VVELLAERGARIEIWNQQNKKGWTPLRIAEGIQRGMNIVGNPATLAALRKAISVPTAVR